MSQVSKASLPAHSNISYQIEVPSSLPMVTSYVQNQHGNPSSNFPNFPADEQMDFIDTTMTATNCSSHEAFMPNTQMVRIPSRSHLPLQHYAFQPPNPISNTFQTNTAVIAASEAAAADPQDIISQDISMQYASTLNLNPIKGFPTGPEQVQTPFKSPDGQPSEKFQTPQLPIQSITHMTAAESHGFETQTRKIPFTPVLETCSSAVIDSVTTEPHLAAAANFEGPLKGLNHCANNPQQWVNFKTENCINVPYSLKQFVPQSLDETTVTNIAVGDTVKKVPRRLKQTIRAVRNRQSATDSRERKKNQIKELNRRIDILSKKNAELQVRQLHIIRAQHDEGQRLIEQNEQQRKKISNYRMQISDLCRELERSVVKTFVKDVRRKPPHTWDESEWGRWNKITAG